jgi:hypothetical protein
MKSRKDWLERLRFQTRLCQEEALITVRQYEYVGGWRKAAKQ